MRAGHGHPVAWDATASTWRTIQPSRPRWDLPLTSEQEAGLSTARSGTNFGSGSSREHAPWGLQQHGFEAIIAPSFGEIFATNCTKIGLLLVTLPAWQCAQLADLSTAAPATEVKIDLLTQTVVWDGVASRFEIDDNRRRMLMDGLGEIAAAMGYEEAIAAYEMSRAPWMPHTVMER